MNKTKPWHCKVILGILCSAFLAGTCSAQTTLISVGAIWKYLDDGTDQDVDWLPIGFDDSSWPSGPAQLGYGDGDEATTNSFGSDAQNVHPTYYYRHKFNIPNASLYTNLGARLLRDDGAIVYLNGTEVFRSNMPTGEVRYTNYATGTAGDDGATFFPFHISASHLVNGDNVVAVELHQANATSSDISFDFQLTGNPVPQISITTPTNNQSVAALNVLVGGTAIPAGPEVGLIEVFANQVKVGESLNANFNVLWQGVSPGSYTLTALITDSIGLKATSAPVAVTILSPPSGSLITRGSVWKYMLGTQEASVPSTLWRTVGFDDGPWSMGAAPIGYGEPNIATTIPESDQIAGQNWTSVYFRKKFTVASPSDYSQLVVEVSVDDGAIVWINGLEVGRINTIPGGEPVFNDVASVAEEVRTLTVTTNAADLLVAGDNVIAIMGFNANLTSSDFLLDAEVRGQVDLEAPFVDRSLPPATATVLELQTIEVFFNEDVLGVDAVDLLINGVPATNVVAIAPNQYLFEFPPLWSR